MRLTAFGLLAVLSLISVSCGGGGKAGAESGFSLVSVKGSYAGIFSGNINTGTELLPILGTGVFISDGAGNLTGHETYTVVTTPCEATIQGTYTVGPDGTGTDSVKFMTSTPGCTGGSYTQSLAIAQSGQLVLLSNTNGDQINEQWHLQN
ncbi:MAG: hypothetical protein ACLQDV_11905 [Candidatus Binataceae bacterium]